METKFWEELKKANKGNKIALEIIEEAQNNPKKGNKNLKGELK